MGKRRRPLDREAFVLAAMSPAGGKRYSPTQIQKLLFLLDREISERTGGPYFDFRPYHYGPFDKDVYHVLESLAGKDQVFIDNGFDRHRCYALTVDGFQKGEGALGQLPPKAQKYIRKCSEFVLSCSFPQLVGAIYRKYPDMRQNSIYGD